MCTNTEALNRLIRSTRGQFPGDSGAGQGVGPLRRASQPYQLLLILHPKEERALSAKGESNDTSSSKAPTQVPGKPADADGVT